MQYNKEQSLMKLLGSEGLVSRARVCLVRSVITLLTVIFCLLGLELGLNVYYAEKQPTAWSQYHSMLGWFLVPGEYWVKPPQKISTFPIRINEFSLRQSNPPIDRPGRYLFSEEA